MASYYNRQALILLLLSLCTFSFIPNPSHAKVDGWLAVYWGQNNGDGTLTSTCDTGLYEIVNLAFLNQFGCGRTPALNFDGHCDNGASTPCMALESEIKHCQEKKVEVFLSLGGAVGDYSLCSADDAKEVAKYLYDNFLSGNYGPLGSVALDGIDFDIEGGSNLYWDDLVRELDALRRENGKKFYLSASPQCPVPDHYLDAAIRTGIFDDLFVQFYNNPSCQYEKDDPYPLYRSWNRWTYPPYANQNTSVFLGLPAAPDAAPGGGYIPAGRLVEDVLPYVKHWDNYGGVILWDRHHDVTYLYGEEIKPYVKKSALRSVTALTEAIFECVSTTLHRLLPKTVPIGRAY